jgi:Domain of unknown function (DUF4388)
MSKPRVTATDQLSNVIEVVELGQRTGLLSVERGSGSVQEEGEIYFISGRAIYAALAGLRGREALAALSRWGACRFAFDRDAPRPAPNLTNPQQPAVRTPPSQPSPAPNPASSWPHYAHSQPGHIPPMSQNGASGSLNGGYGRPAYPASGSSFGAVQPGPPTGSLNSVQPGPPTGSLNLSAGALGADQRRPYPPAPTTPASGWYGGGYGGAQGGGYQQGAGGVNGAALNRRPRRAPDVRDLMIVVNTHNLSRSHRTVLLLADGEHSVLDLARLSSKAPDEVVGLLGELEERGLIYYYE